MSKSCCRRPTGIFCPPPATTTQSNVGQQVHVVIRNFPLPRYKPQSADLLIIVVGLQLAGPDRPLDLRGLYPFWAITSGLVWWIVGSYWGRGYVISLAFFALALLIPPLPRLGPPGFGLLWTAVLLALSWQLRRLRASEKIG